MPSLKRKTKRKRNSYGDDHITHLATGHDFFNTAFGRVANLPQDEPARKQRETAIHDAMEVAWAELRASVLDYHKKHPCNALATRPWGWWEFDSPAPRDPSLHEQEQLHRMDEVNDVERQAALNAWEEPSHFNYFRRPWEWWNLRSPAPRDYTTPETLQLVALERRGGEVLSAAEVGFTKAEPSRDVFTILNYQTRLEPAEYKALGLGEVLPKGVIA